MVDEEVDRIRHAVREELDKFHAELQRAGLSTSEPLLVAFRPGREEFVVELKVEFSREGDLVDIFEFFVCLHGKLVTTEDEVRQWIRDNVPGVIHKQLAQAELDRRPKN